MIRAGLRRRAILLALLGTHVLSSLAALADAHLERPRPDAVHIEASAGDCGAPVHVHELCALCQHLDARTFVQGGECWTPFAGLEEVSLPRIESSRASTILPLPRGRSPPKA